MKFLELPKIDYIKSGGLLGVVSGRLFKGVERKANVDLSLEHPLVGLMAGANECLIRQGVTPLCERTGYYEGHP
jgi:hypothetical protein